jgi:hypothetical protein
MQSSFIIKTTVFWRINLQTCRLHFPDIHFYFKILWKESMNPSEYIYFFPQDICVTQMSEIMSWKYLEGSTDDIMRVSV